MLKFKQDTDKVIRTFYKVYNHLGYGFLEKVYENALAYELQRQGFTTKQQYQVEVFYQDLRVGHYFADIIVDNWVIIEVKASEGLVEADEYQLINYLKASEIEIGLLFNFGKKPQFKRKIFSNKNTERE